MIVASRSGKCTLSTKCGLTEGGQDALQWCMPVIKLCGLLLIRVKEVNEIRMNSNAKTPLAELEKCGKQWVSHFE